jgi:hypothetical protein
MKSVFEKYSYGIGWLYQTDLDNKYRYVLGNNPNNSNKLLVCFGINPSTASPEKLDNTVTRVAKAAEANGFDGWIMFNIYPQRTTNPDNLEATKNNFYHEKNLRAIEELLSYYKIESVWYAYGNLISKRDYLKNCLNDIEKIVKGLGIKRLGAGTPTKEGNPRHPLYLGKDELLLKALYEIE